MTCLQEQSRLSMQQEQERSRSLLVSSLQQEVGKWEGLLQEKEGHLTAALEEGQAKAMEKTEQAIKEVCAGGEGRADGVLVSRCSMIHPSQSLHSLTHRTCTILLPSPPLPSPPCPACCTPQLQEKELMKLEEAIAVNSKKQEKALQEALEVGEVVAMATHLCDPHQHSPGLG